MITDDFLPGVCGNYQMYPEISQELMWYPRVTFFEWFLDEATPVVWLLRVANRDSNEITTHKLQSLFLFFSARNFTQGLLVQPLQQVVQDNDISYH